MEAWLKRFGLMAVVLVSVCAGAQQNGWVVKPEWVRAHEEFLASDVMAGRGSGTRDEEITATYVASEFMAYGLKPAPGMAGYLQSGELVAPTLDGTATLALGGAVVKEGADFDLVVSSGQNVSGPLVRLHASDLANAHFAKGSVVLLEGSANMNVARRAMATLGRAGAVAVLLPGNGELAGLYAMAGGKTRTSIRLKESAAAGNGAATVVLRDSAITQLKGVKDGETVALSVHAVEQKTPRLTFNAIGWLAGTDPASGTILLTAHLDHLGTRAAVDGDAIYNGANDDAAGTTAVLELAHALAAGPKLKRNVLFVCYGSEELGRLGSIYFGNHLPVPLASLIVNLEFEMIGAQDPKMPKGVLLLTGWERSNLGPTLKEHGALVGPDPYPEEHFFERSDNYSLALQGLVAHTAAGWGTVPTYHRPDDDMAHLDLPFMTAAIQSLVEPVRWLASSDFKPSWNAGGQPVRQ